MDLLRRVGGNEADLLQRRQIARDKSVAFVDELLCVAVVVVVVGTTIEVLNLLVVGISGGDENDIRVMVRARKIRSAGCFPLPSVIGLVGAVDDACTVRSTAGDSIGNAPVDVLGEGKLKLTRNGHGGGGGSGGGRGSSTDSCVRGGTDRREISSIEPWWSRQHRRGEGRPRKQQPWRQRVPWYLSSPDHGG